MSTTLTAERCFYKSTRFSKFPFVQALRKEFGLKGYTLSIVILEEIASSGIEVRSGRKFRENIVKEFPDISHNLIKMVIRRMTDSGFLDKAAFVMRGVLTPPAKYIAASKEEITNGMVDDSAPYIFIKDTSLIVSSEETDINTEEIDINSEETTNNNHLLINNTHYGTTKETRS